MSQELSKYIRDVPGFPKAGIVFKDITTLLNDGKQFSRAVSLLDEHFKGTKVDAVLGIESRGFILGGALAFKRGLPFIPARKPGKLPWKKVREEYHLEYGTDAIEIHEDSISRGQNVLVIDDLLATGGTALAAVKLVEKLGGNVCGIGFLIELVFLNGREKLDGYDVFSLVKYESE
ncbi:MAG: adenine phosphoribosyltransferase [Candidatus Eisenbacteria bacterium]|nr:adenine phosphoribosyltransferase [Candidatus Eisenbacteria bacterium]